MKHPYCLVNRPICSGGLPVSCWQLIETGDAFLNKRGDKVFVYGVDSIENETMVITDEKTNEKYTLTSDHDCRNFNVYWKSDEEFERKLS
ncbi:protein of unknown function [Pseudotevenvirus RB43]|uniref:Uncharacterized protein n=2 Tax=Pseudotevenvirus RB43 TaxID=115991 RepID=Q56BR2_9CAUD|nr:hypothetical protein RB43ORF136c [Escherichia phage RB43]AAX78658.1 hypothetical protein RB43ORF136c [Escherichia phage RB43]QJI10894.1 hypothetical protein GuL6_136 [Buttiauxella phage vB_ButM_GuL6]CCK73983.1 protein of unknown function [Pseudotevenvirus RB43]CCL97600.1 protein of unknown function [Pseudotevenvirus RB43]